MKKKYVFRIVFTVVCVLSAVCLLHGTSFAKSPSKLKVQGTTLVDENGKTIQLKGISTHGLSWFPEYVNKNSFKYMKKKWKINTVRLAMYTSDYNGYCTGDAANKSRLLKLIDDGVKYATDTGLYVIIDWHILNDNNPMEHKKESISFFKKMAKKYKNYSNVLYEICNEPNGGTNWSTIKSYSESVISKIRKYDKDAVVIVGTPTWSQDVDLAAADRLSSKYGNVMYTLHFYAATHGEFLRDKARKALDAGLPLFVSEFGICDASGNGGISKAEAAKWFKLLNERHVSMVAWNLSNKNESSAFIKPECKKLTGWKNSDLSESAKWIIKQYKKMK